MAITGYHPYFSKPERVSRNRIEIKDESGIIVTITSPQDDDRAEIIAELIHASPTMWRALRSIQSYAEVVRATQATLDQVIDFAVAALENLKLLEKANQ